MSLESRDKKTKYKISDKNHGWKTSNYPFFYSVPNQTKDRVFNNDLEKVKPYHSGFSI
jgi:hypothetical protein